MQPPAWSVSWVYSITGIVFGFAEANFLITCCPSVSPTLSHLEVIHNLNVCHPRCWQRFWAISAPVSNHLLATAYWALLLAKIFLPYFFRWNLFLPSSLCFLKRVSWKDKPKPCLRHHQCLQELIYWLPSLLPKYFALTDMAAWVLVSAPFTPLEICS